MSGQGRNVGGRLLVVSHPAVLPVNQLVYAELVGRGWHVELVVPARWRHEFAAGDFAPQPLPALASSFRATPIALPGRPQRHFYLANPFRVLRSARPDVIFVEQEAFSLAAAQWAAAARALKIPFGVQAAEDLDRHFPAPIRALRSWVLHRAAFVATRSPAAGRMAESWGAKGQVRLIPHHVPGWQPRERSASDRFRVGYAGRLVPEKGLDVLVAAVRRLDGPRQLVVAGDGPLRGWLEAQDLGGSALNLISGLPHDQMDTAYGQMDVLVLPSRSTPTWVEQFGRVLVEALTCGVPVLGSDSGEIGWVIESTGGGMVFPEGDSSALAKQLEMLRDDDEARTRYATVGQQRARGLFSVGAVASELEEVLRRASSSPLATT